MTIAALQYKLRQLPRFSGGSSFVILSDDLEDSKLTVAPAEGSVTDLEAEFYFRHAHELEALVDQLLATPHLGKCGRCGCTDDNCSGCVERSGQPCHWVAPNLCSACAQEH